MKLIYDITLHDYIHLYTLWQYICELNVYNSEKRATFLYYLLEEILYFFDCYYHRLKEIL